MAIATACLRLLTFFPEPLFKVPCLCSCITFPTFFFCDAVAMSWSPYPAWVSALPRNHMQAVEQEVATPYNHRGSTDPKQRYE